VASVAIELTEAVIPREVAAFRAARRLGGGGLRDRAGNDGVPGAPRLRVNHYGNRTLVLFRCDFLTGCCGF
jgi:hypothetical protein